MGNATQVVPHRPLQLPGCSLPLLVMPVTHTSLVRTYILGVYTYVRTWYQVPCTNNIIPGIQRVLNFDDKKRKRKKEMPFEIGNTRPAAMKKKHHPTIAQKKEMLPTVDNAHRLRTSRVQVAGEYLVPASIRSGISPLFHIKSLTRLTEKAQNDQAHHEQEHPRPLARGATAPVGTVGRRPGPAGSDHVVALCFSLTGLHQGDDKTSKVAALPRLCCLVVSRRRYPV